MMDTSSYNNNAVLHITFGSKCMVNKRFRGHPSYGKSSTGRSLVQFSLISHAARQSKISDFGNRTISNEDVTSSKVTMNDSFRRQVFLQKMICISSNASHETLLTRKLKSMQLLKKSIQTL